jgi:Icc-related predicted phosphoesterase
MGDTKIFYATDIHGSERTFIKFLNAGKFYGANILLMGGDITGKMIVPIRDQGDGTFKSRLLGTEYVLKTESEIQEMEKNIRFNGYYPYRVTEAEKQELDANPQRVDELFSKLMVAAMERWLQIAEERLKGTGIKCYITPGNDDRIEIDNAFQKSDFVINPEGRLVQIDEFHEMISSGYVNMTPWKAPRDILEEELQKKIDALTSQVKNMPNCIFNFHVPPFDSGLDSAPKLDADLRPTVGPSGFVMISAGSTSLKKAIEVHQPLLGLHGHIHEASGFKRIGRTLCLNPGSEYSEGVLRGAVVTLSKDKVKSYILTRG